jgi:hypothetical protein
LRQGKGSLRRHTDTVRGGRTGAHLYTARSSEQDDRLASAARKDAQALLEERQFRGLTVPLLGRFEGTTSGTTLTSTARIRARAARPPGEPAGPPPPAFVGFWCPPWLPASGAVAAEDRTASATTTPPR